MCCILCTLGFGMRAGMVSAIICVSCAGIIGMAFHLQFLSLQFEPSLYLNSLSGVGHGCGLHHFIRRIDGYCPGYDEYTVFYADQGS